MQPYTQSANLLLQIYRFLWRLFRTLQENCGTHMEKVPTHTFKFDPFIYGYMPWGWSSKQNADCYGWIARHARERLPSNMESFHSFHGENAHRNREGSLLGGFSLWDSTFVQPEESWVVQKRSGCNFRIQLRTHGVQYSQHLLLSNPIGRGRKAGPKPLLKEH